MNRHLKVIIIVGIIAIILLLLFIKINAQEGEEQLKILTEMKIDIKYIKSNINEIKEDNKIAKEQMRKLENRVTRTEERQLVIRNDLCEIAEKNNWVTGFIGSVLLLMLGLQLKRSYSHRKETNGKITH